MRPNNSMQLIPTHGHAGCSQTPQTRPQPSRPCSGIADLGRYASLILARDPMPTVWSKMLAGRMVVRLRARIRRKDQIRRRYSTDVQTISGFCFLDRDYHFSLGGNNLANRRNFPGSAYEFLGSAHRDWRLWHRVCDCRVYSARLWLSRYPFGVATRRAEHHSASCDSPAPRLSRPPLILRVSSVVFLLLIRACVPCALHLSCMPPPRHLP